MTKGRYFKWLLKLIDCDAGKYGYLMVALFNKEFYWTMPLDENRAEDGKTLRDLFCETKKIDDASDIFGPCTVLEMMIALARRWRMDITSEDGSDDGFGLYFWEMIENLGLKDCTNETFQPEIVDEKLNFMLDRDYSANGVGSLFPVASPKIDQKKSEIWYQLQAYLAEQEES